MAQLPTAVRLGPHSIEIRADEDTAHRLREEGARGDSRPDRLVLQVDPDRPHTAVAETLLHELMHHAWEQTSLRAEDDEGGCGDRDLQERVVTGLAPLLLGALRDNPDLVVFLTAS